MSRNILVVEDNKDLARLLELHLRDLSYDVDLAFDGDAGWTQITSQSYDLIILDLMLPGIDGLEICRRIRSCPTYTPILMLTSKSTEFDRVLGLEIGADDYVPKPCNLRELVARIRAITRRIGRTQENADSGGHGTVIGDLKIEAGSQSVFRSDKLIALTGAEYLVLEALVQSAGQVVDKDSIARHALGRRIMPYDRSVDAHVSNLRKKLGPLSDGRQRIKTVRGRGYLYVTSS